LEVVAVYLTCFNILLQELCRIWSLSVVDWLHLEFSG